MIFLFWSSVKTHFEKEWKNTVKIKELWTKRKVSSLGAQPKPWEQESHSQEFLLDSWLWANGAQGKPRDQHARATKGQSSKGGVWKIRLICWESHIIKNRLRGRSARRMRRAGGFAWGTKGTNSYWIWKLLAPPIGDSVRWKKLEDSWVREMKQKKNIASGIFISIPNTWTIYKNRILCCPSCPVV